MVDLLKRIMGRFQKRPFDEEVASLFREYGVDPNTLKFMDDFAAAAHEVIERATQDGTAKGKDIAVQLSYHVGILDSNSGNVEQAAVVWRQAVTLGKDSTSPVVLALAALMAFVLVDTGMVSREEEETLLYQAMELGEKSNTPLGLNAAANAALGIGLYLAHGWFAGEEAHQAWRRAVELGRRSSNDAGWETAAMAAFNLGEALELESSIKRLVPLKLEAEGWLQQAIDLGLKSGTGEGQVWAQRAKNLLDRLQQQDELS